MKLGDSATLIDQVYPYGVRRELASSVSEGSVVVAANPGAGMAELVKRTVPDTVVLRPREAGTPLGFRIQFARALVEGAAAQGAREQPDQPARAPAVALLAPDFGRRARDVVALAQGEIAHDVAFEQLVGGLRPHTVVVIDAAHLVHAVAGPEVLWSLRDHRRVVLVTPPWFVDQLRQRDAAFFGHGRTLRLTSEKFDPPLKDPNDKAFLLERALGNAELIAEILTRDETDVREAWRQAVAARRAVASSFLTAAFAIHQFGPRLLQAIAAGEPPYAAIPDGSTARIANALRALRDSEFVYPPRPRRWRLVDPAMATALQGPFE